jgi:hypothetical protein
MSDDTDRSQRQESPGRIFHATAYGDTADEMEMYALDKARAFFGSAFRLEIVPDYQVCRANPRDGTGKSYVAGMRIRTIGDPS